jgi:hypothetical protein
MSIKSKMLAGAAALTLAGGLSVVGTVAASAATPQCSAAGTCIEVYSAKYATAASLGWVETVFRGIPRRGVPTEVRPASSTNPAEDLMIPLAGTVNDLYADGMVSAAVNKHFGLDHAVQIEYAPYGQPTGLCTAVAATAYQNEALSLQPCSRPGVTVWILGSSAATFPIINGSDTDFARPFVMTILGNPAHQPFTPIIMRHLTGRSGQPPANQLWGAHFGVTP